MDKAEEIYHKIIENYDECNYMAEQEGIELITQYATEVSRETILEFLVHYDSVMYPAMMSEFDKWKSKQEEQS